MARLNDPKDANMTRFVGKLEDHLNCSKISQALPKLSVALWQEWQGSSKGKS